MTYPEEHFGGHRMAGHAWDRESVELLKAYQQRRPDPAEALWIMDEPQESLSLTEADS